MAEPEWDESTRNMALALDDCDRTQMCGVCGQPKHICQNPDYQFDWTTDPPTRCHAATASIIQKRGFKDDPSAPIEALLFTARLREGVQ